MWLADRALVAANESGCSSSGIASDKLGVDFCAEARGSAEYWAVA